MTAQINDYVKYAGEEWALAGANGEPLFEPKAFGLEPREGEGTREELSIDGRGGAAAMTLSMNPGLLPRARMGRRPCRRVARRGTRIASEGAHDTTRPAARPPRTH